MMCEGRLAVSGKKFTEVMFSRLTNQTVGNYKRTGNLLWDKWREKIANLLFRMSANLTAATLMVTPAYYL